MPPKLLPGSAIGIRDLFAIALDTQPDSSDAGAFAMLVELQSPCPDSCEDVLRMIAHSRLNLSNGLVPLYLITQFGLHRLPRA